MRESQLAPLGGPIVGHVTEAWRDHSIHFCLCVRTIVTIKFKQ